MLGERGKVHDQALEISNDFEATSILQNRRAETILRSLSTSMHDESASAFAFFLFERISKGKFSNHFVDKLLANNLKFANIVCIFLLASMPVIIFHNQLKVVSE